MLVISRRENERFLFPNLGISIELIKVAGRVAKIGVDAPRHIRVLREELVDESNIAKLPIEFAGVRDALPKEAKHQFRNRLQPISLGLQVAQKLIDTGRFEELKSVLEKVVDELKTLDRDLLVDSPNRLLERSLPK